MTSWDKISDTTHFQLTKKQGGSWESLLQIIDWKGNGILMCKMTTVRQVPDEPAKTKMIL